VGEDHRRLRRWRNSWHFVLLLSVKQKVEKNEWLETGERRWRAVDLFTSQNYYYCHYY
jgi:hypothetical protein